MCCTSRPSFLYISQLILALRLAHPIRFYLIILNSIKSIITYATHPLTRTSFSLGPNLFRPIVSLIYKTHTLFSCKSLHTCVTGWNYVMIVLYILFCDALFITFSTWKLLRLTSADRISILKQTSTQNIRYNLGKRNILEQIMSYLSDRNAYFTV